MLAYALEDVVANELGGTLGDLEAKAVLEMLTNALGEVKGHLATHWVMWRHMHWLTR